MVRLFYLLLIPIFLSGCTTEYFIRKFMDGPKFCHSEEMNKVVQNRRSFKHLSVRLRREFVLLNMPTAPDKTVQVQTSDGHVYIVDYYQTTGSFICGGEGLWGEYEPVVYLGGVISGTGNDYYEKIIEPKIVGMDEVEIHEN